MKELRKKMDGDWVYIKVSDKEYEEAVKKAKEELGIKSQEEAEKEEDEIEDYILYFFNDKFEEQLEADLQDAQDQENYYKELNSWLNKQQGV